MEVPLNELAVGDQVIIKPGEKVPVDGGIVRGSSSVDESMLTENQNLFLKKLELKSLEVP